MPRVGRSDEQRAVDNTPRGLTVGWRALMAAVIVCGSVMPLFAQITYNVFPAVPAAASVSTPQPTDPGSERVTLIVQDSTIAFAVHALVHQAHLKLVYDIDNPVFAKRISIRVVDERVMDAVAIILKGTGLAAKLAPDGQTIMIRALAGSSSAEHALAGGTVVGHVTDSASGQGLAGASVRVAGTKLSSVTSDSGNFTLRDVPPGDQLLTVRLFGYKPAERTVTVVDSERTTVHVVMVAVPTVLSGVVTTATGLQRKVEVGNDITTLNVDSIMQVAPVTSVTDLLETRVPGLTVLHSDGVPGDPSRLRLRGPGSVQLNSDPIVIVDGVRVYASQSDSRNNNLAQGVQLNASGANNIGVSNPNASADFAAPSPLDQIDPSSIATIEVLKGPSATAIYGSDAASGVIVITTKHGHAGPTHWSLALADGVNWLPGSWPTNDYLVGYDPENYANGFYNFHNPPLCSWYAPFCHVDSVIAFQALNDPQFTVFSHGSDQTANLTVSGGVPTLTYSLTGSAAGDVGNLKLPGIEQQRYDSAYGPIPSYFVHPDNYQTWGVGGSLTALPTSQLRVTLQSSLFNSAQQQSSLNGAISQLEGEYIDAYDLANNALIQGELERATDNQLTSTNTLSLHWQPYAWLPLEATGGINTIQRTDVTYVPYGIEANGPEEQSSDTTGSYGLGRGTSQDQTLTVGTVLPRPHLTLAIGGSLYSESTADFSVYTNQLAPGVSTPTSFLQSDGTNSPTSQSTLGQSTYGWYVEPRLNVASRFFVAPGFRLDGGSGASSSAGSVSGLSAFPKIDLSYVAVDRSSGHPLWGVLTLLRPRLAFGVAGTQPGPVDKLRLYNVNSQTISGSSILNFTTGCNGTNTLDGNTTVSTVCLSSLGNTQLRPERSHELEGGFDATLWRGRLSLTYTQYNKTRTDAILDIPVAPSVYGGGSDDIEKNIGVIRNTGTELTANAIVLQSRAVSWTVGANLSNDNNLVVRLNPGQAPIVLARGSGGIQERVTPGYPLFGEWALPIAGFADANHDGIIEANEIRYGDSAVYVGQPEPKYQFNLNTDLTLLNGRVTVHATFAYQNGLTQDNQGACSSGAFALLPDVPHTPLATEAAVVASGCDNIGPAITGIGLIQTVNTFRFQDLSINYAVPPRVSTWFRVPRMTVALQGSNLGLHTNYRGMDPDVNAFSTVSAGDETADLGQIPEPRTWWLRLSVGN
jgi:TonB-dependent SusC/RagA subfamily outer membrane receptor